MRGNMPQTQTAVFLFYPEREELQFKTPRSTAFIVRRKDIWEELVERCKAEGVTETLRGRVRFSESIGEYPVIYDIRFKKSQNPAPLPDEIELGPR